MLRPFMYVSRLRSLNVSHLQSESSQLTLSDVVAKQIGINILQIQIA